MFASIKASRNAANWQMRFLTLIIVLLSFLFVISLFKNISYPLFWADEGSTVMGGVRVLQFGYPKVHDGKNVYYELQHHDKTLGIDKKTDAYIGGASWGQYYVAALGVKLAEFTDNIYTKTRIIRTIFAFLGLTGIILFALLGARFFPPGYSRKGFLALFLLIELLSVPLALHLRDARYYALTVFLTGLIVFVYAKYRILKDTRYPAYAVLSFILMILLFMTFSPAYFVFLGAIGIFETLAMAICPLRITIDDSRIENEQTFTWSAHLKTCLRNLLPCLLSLAAVSPLLVFFDTFNISKKLTEYYAWGYNTDASGLYIRNLSFFWDFFASHDLIYLAMIMKIMLLPSLLPGVIRDRRLPSSDAQKVIFSFFLSIVFIVYSLLIPKIPNPLFTRYIIPLQPVLALIIIMDSSVIFQSASRYRSGVMRYARHAVAVMFIIGILVNVSNNWSSLRGHVFELTHRYQGPLDYVIPFIQGRFGKTDDLVIATNYEETSYMYYLNARVTVGYVGNNIEEDSLIQPDIMVYRGWWRNFRPFFEDFMQRHPYERISFPVPNHPVNNIPELHHPVPLRHQFQTLECGDEMIKAAVFIKK